MPNYKYCYCQNKNTRIIPEATHKSLSHKFLFRKNNFKTNPQLKYEEGLTEQKLAELNGLYRVYDSGKIKWTKTIKHYINATEAIYGR